MKVYRHWRNRKDWSVTVCLLGAEVSLIFESRYYRTCGLCLWLSERGPIVLWPYTPSEEENRALDARNYAAMQRRQQEGDE